jgi:membrane protease subunit (stomatin/prohibitin family)
MSILDKVKEAALNQFIEVIEWLDDSKDTLLYRFRSQARRSRTARN